jgi:hypothetical protein
LSSCLMARRVHQARCVVGFIANVNPKFKLITADHLNRRLDLRGAKGTLFYGDIALCSYQDRCNAW